MTLKDDDPRWDLHSGGSMHYGTEWDPGDLTAAADFWPMLSVNASLILDLLIDHPGELTDADQLAAYIGQERPEPGRVPDRMTVRSSLSTVGKAYEASDRRRLPFDWWKGADGQPSLYATKPAVARLFRQARRRLAGAAPSSQQDTADWSSAEVTAVVTDYLAMLAAEAAGQRYSKAGHRQVLRQRLGPARSDSAIEYKHQNISAAMLDLGLPCIRGYKARGNYQAALTEEIIRQLDADTALITRLPDTARDDVLTGTLEQADPPQPSARRAGAARPAAARRVDYGVLHERNRRLGARGERLVVGYEQARLRRLGRPDLADQVRWVAGLDGDGVGFDVGSFGADGSMLHIEVKTTSEGAEAPFYLTTAELEYSRRHSSSYALYRVYPTPQGPRFYALYGDITSLLELAPVTYRAALALPASPAA